jgi:hypothetical protein
MKERRSLRNWWIKDARTKYSLTVNAVDPSYQGRKIAMVSPYL